MFSSTTTALEQFDNQHEFERLAADILNALGNTDVVLTAPRGGSDGGRDVTLTTENGGKGLACVSLRKDSDKKFGEDFHQRQKGDFDKYFFFTNQYLTAEQKKKYTRYCLDTLDAEFVPYDIEALRSLLDSVLKSIREAYLQIPEAPARAPKLGLVFSGDGKIPEENVYPQNTEWLWQDINKYVQAELSAKRTTLSQMLERGKNIAKQKEIDEFRNAYEKYLTNLEPALKMQFVKEYMPHCQIEFIFFNDGNVSANDISIFFTFPEGSAVIELDGREGKISIEKALPSEPTIPSWAQLSFFNQVQVERTLTSILSAYPFRPMFPVLSASLGHSHIKSL